MTQNNLISKFNKYNTTDSLPKVKSMLSTDVITNFIKCKKQSNNITNNLSTKNKQIEISNTCFVGDDIVYLKNTVKISKLLSSSYKFIVLTNLSIIIYNNEHEFLVKEEKKSIYNLFDYTYELKGNKIKIIKDNKINDIFKKNTNYKKLVAKELIFNKKVICILWYNTIKYLLSNMLIKNNNTLLSNNFLRNPKEKYVEFNKNLITSSNKFSNNILKTNKTKKQFNELKSNNHTNFNLQSISYLSKIDKRYHSICCPKSIKFYRYKINKCVENKDNFLESEIIVYNSSKKYNHVYDYNMLNTYSNKNLLMSEIAFNNSISSIFNLELFKTLRKCKHNKSIKTNKTYKLNTDNNENYNILLNSDNTKLSLKICNFDDLLSNILPLSNTTISYHTNCKNNLNKNILDIDYRQNKGFKKNSKLIKNSIMSQKNYNISALNFLNHQNSKKFDRNVICNTNLKKFCNKFANNTKTEYYNINSDFSDNISDNIVKKKANINIDLYENNNYQKKPMYKLVKRDALYKNTIISINNNIQITNSDFNNSSYISNILINIRIYSNPTKFFKLINNEMDTNNYTTINKSCNTFAYAKTSSYIYEIINKYLCSSVSDTYFLRFIHKLYKKFLKGLYYNINIKYYLNYNRYIDNCLKTIVIKIIKEDIKCYIKLIESWHNKIITYTCQEKYNYFEIKNLVSKSIEYLISLSYYFNF